MAQLYPDDILVDFVHNLRQPLSALEALTTYLDLITTTDDPRVHEQLRRIHSQIGLADQILRDGVRKLRAHAAVEGRAILAEGPPPQPEIVEDLTRPLTNAAMASVTN